MTTLPIVPLPASPTVNLISRFFIPNHLSGKYIFSLHSHPHASPKFVCNNNIGQFASFSPFCDEKLHGWCKKHRWMGERFPYFFRQHYLSQADAFFLCLLFHKAQRVETEGGSEGKIVAYNMWDCFKGSNAEWCPICFPCDEITSKIPFTRNSSRTATEKASWKAGERDRLLRMTFVDDSPVLKRKPSDGPHQ